MDREDTHQVVDLGQFRRAHGPDAPDVFHPSMQPDLSGADTFQRALEILGRGMLEDAVNWFGDETAKNLTVMVLGLGGESGEVLDILKKITRGSTTLEDSWDAIAIELVDVFIYWCMLITMLQIDVVGTYSAKRQFNAQRFGGDNAPSTDSE